MKSDLLKELERHKSQFNGYRGNPSISEEALDTVVQRIDSAFNNLNDLPGKAGVSLTSNEWLMSIRSRISIPGGLANLISRLLRVAEDASATETRRSLEMGIDLDATGSRASSAAGLLRDSGKPQKVVTTGGQYQQSLPPGRVYQLMRVRLNAEEELIPEISGHRLMAMVRLMKQDAEGRLRPATVDTSFELSLCV